MTILDALFGGRSQRQREALIDLLLVTAHADGEVTLSDLDRIARAIQTNDALKGIDWDLVLSREREVRQDAPLFADTRERLARDLGDMELRRFGIQLAAKCASTPLTQEEREVLDRVAAALDIPEAEREALVSPWTEADPFRLGYVRTAYNDPEIGTPLTYGEALERAESEAELRLLLFKATSTRAVMAKLSEETELVSFGEIIDIGAAHVRIDAFLRAGERSYVVRFLSAGEALYPAEHKLLLELLDQMESSVSLYIAVADTAPPPDEAALRRLPPERLIIERVER
ncbi:MAG: TerB family tellurite resistance protein [Myxococcota bacterium]